MSNPVTVLFRDGTKKLFKDNGRAGGSYQQRVEWGAGHVTIVDVWEQRTSFPLDLVQEVNECPTHY